MRSPKPGGYPAFPSVLAAEWRWLLFRSPLWVRKVAWAVHLGPRGYVWRAAWSRWAWPVLRPLPLVLPALVVFVAFFLLAWLFPGFAAIAFWLVVWLVPLLCL